MNLLWHAVTVVATLSLLLLSHICVGMCTRWGVRATNATQKSAKDDRRQALFVAAIYLPRQMLQLATVPLCAINRPFARRKQMLLLLSGAHSCRMSTHVQTRRTHHIHMRAHRAATVAAAGNQQV